MQSTGGQADPTAEFTPNKTQRRAGRRIGSSVWVTLLGCVVGGVIGLLAFWTDPQPEEAVGGDWTWAIPELSPEIGSAYRELFDTARDAVAQVMEDHPGNPHAISALGVLCYLGHDRQLEAQTWEHLLDVDPGNSLAFQRLCTLAQEEADHQRIVDLATTLLERDPGNATYADKLGGALLYLKRYTEAKNVLERIVRRGDGDADTYFVLGEACYQLDELRRAKRYYSAAVALSPYSSSMLFGLIKVCRKLGEQEEAAEHQRYFQELKAAETAASEVRGAGSRDRFSDVLHIPTRVSEILRNVGKAYGDVRQHELAEQHWSRAAELNPEESESRQLLANLYDDRGDLQAALRWVRELGQLFPDDPAHQRNEALLLIRLGKYDEAEQILRKLCRLEPTRSSGYRELAGLLVRRGGDLAEAKQLALYAVELEPTAPHFFLLATVAYQAKDLPTARASLEQALARDPENETYRRFYATLSQIK